LAGSKVLDWAKVRGYRTGENPARWRGYGIGGEWWKLLIGGRIGCADCSVRGRVRLVRTL
jgi:hypothetical protein